MSLKKEVSFYWVILAGAAALVIVSVFWLVTDVRHLHQMGIIDYPAMQNFHSLRFHRPLSAALTVDNIRDWMTFDYINQQLHLPSDYLKGKLEITDTRYPRITLSEAAEASHVPTSAIVSAVQNAVREYAPPVTAPLSKTPSSTNTE